ncbi:multidrug and toxin extrusion protein 1-like isoform X2 [Corythoichthys intestinalis]|uniref:multidrug and toxin extrusion protein 1-like isoform X2 n=1 Tax=Corythoichthys intestinalis TaxID=161448 RepID=UPI0025A535BB|nr:multidrug and toxin extrusion protein 1-like isoform X2 [Corythoichthys intestinalis]
MAGRSGDKMFFCRLICLKMPLNHREEMYHILRMTGPLLLSRVLIYLLPFVVTMFCGRLGNDVMAGFGLASATINVTTAATGYGLSLACDTLVSQTFGGKNLLRVGMILQRGVVILLLFCLPCWGLLLNAQSLLLLMGQDPEVTRIAQVYIIAFLPAVPGIILPQMYTAAMANVVNLLMNYVFLHWLDLGVTGSAVVNAFSQICICASLFIYIHWKKLHVSTWGGWSVESLQEWGSYMRLAVPSMLMKCFEWWIYEFGGFFAGMLSDDELAAQHAVMMVTLLAYMFPFGIQAAACARVGNALGAGDTGRAIIACKVSLTLAGAFAVVEGIVLGATKSKIGYIFTSDQKIVNLVSLLMNAYCFLQFFDGLVVSLELVHLLIRVNKNNQYLSFSPSYKCVCTGIFLGAGKQKIPAVANFVGYYGIGLTLSVTLMFVAKLRILGFWLGILICVILQSTLFIIVIFRLDWERMTEEAVKRAQKNTHVAEQEQYQPVMWEANAVPQQQVNADQLPVSQLLLRRGLTLLAAIALLAIGTCVYLLVPLPEAPPSKSNLTAIEWGNSTHY